MKFLGKRPAPTGAAANATTRQRGNAAEDRALAYLQAQGLQLLERNYRTPGRGGGEIDLILRERDGTVVFVEVRSRSSNAVGGAGSSIGLPSSSAWCLPRATTCCATRRLRHAASTSCWYRTGLNGFRAPLMRSNLADPVARKCVSCLLQKL
jgi:Holliday junction resolvase-like predicted endonuclease